MTDFIKTLQNECKKIALLFKINKYDVFGTRKEESSASSKEKKPFGLNASNRSSVTLRVWNHDDQVGVTSTSNLTSHGLQLAFESALNAAQFNNHSETSYDFSPLCLPTIEPKTPDLKPSVLSSIQNLTKVAIECEELILNSHPSIKSVPYNKVSQSCYERFYFNSQSILKYQKIPSTYCYFYPLAQEENKTPRQMGHVTLAENFNELNYRECANTAIEKTKKHLNYEKVPTGKYPIIFSPEAFLDLVGAFSNFFNAQNVLDNKSLSSKETLNTQVASKYLNITDDPLHDKHIGKPYFDEEGTPTAELTIIENGLLKSFIHTSSTAKIFNTKPTGHTSLGAKLTAAPHFLKIFASQNFATQEKPKVSFPLIYVENVKALHAGINALQGSFSLPFDGFIVQDEKQTSIESATIAGDFLTLLKNIIYISPEEQVTNSGICPEIWVEDLSVTGN
jgi:PmbA protein